MTLPRFEPSRISTSDAPAHDALMNLINRKRFVDELLNKVRTHDAGAATAFTTEELDALKMLAKLDPKAIARALKPQGVPPTPNANDEDDVTDEDIEGLDAPAMSSQGPAPGFSDDETAALKSLAAMAPEFVRLLSAPQQTADSLGPSGSELWHENQLRAAYGLPPLRSLPARTTDAADYKTLEDQLREYQSGATPKAPALPEHARLEDKLYHYQRYGNTPPDAA